MRKKYKTLVIYPFLFGILPVFILFTGNLNAVTFPMVYRSLMIVLGFTALLLILMRLVLRDWARAGLVTTFLTLFVVYFFRFSLLLSDLFSSFQETPIQIPVAIVTSIMILGLWAIIRLIRRPGAFTPSLNFIAVCMILINLSTITFYKVQQQFRNPLIPTDESFFTVDSISQSAHQSKRDIYYIILDEYVRSDVLQELYGLDNHDFLDNLTSQGFYIADQSHSNYSQTILSISSSLNMQYLDKLAALDPKSDNRSPLIGLIGNSQVRRFLAEQGYRLVAFDTGYYGTIINDADVFIKRQHSINIFENMMINDSLVFVAFDKIGKPFLFEGMIDQFHQLDEAAKLSGPKFVFAHFVLPHPPFLIDQNGNMQDEYSASISDGNFFSGSKDDYRNGYREQMIFLNQRLGEIIDHILSSSDPEPIIIIQGDHGSGLFLENDSYADSCIRERLSILNAYYLPGEQGANLYADITPVNSFRMILNAYFGTDLPLLDDESYFSTLSRPFSFHKVSEEQLTQSCESVIGNH